MTQVADMAASAAKTATYTGGAVSATGGFLLSNHAMAWAGMLIAAAGLVWQVWLGIRRDRRESAERAEKHAEHLERMRKGFQVVTKPMPLDHHG